MVTSAWLFIMKFILKILYYKFIEKWRFLATFFYHVLWHEESEIAKKIYGSLVQSLDDVFYYKTNFYSINGVWYDLDSKILGNGGFLDLG